MALNSILSVYELAANKQLALAHPFTPLRKQPLIPELITSLTQAGMRGVMPSPCVSSNPAASLSLVPSQRRSLYLQIKQAGGHSLLPTLGKHQFSGILLFLAAHRPNPTCVPMVCSGLGMSSTRDREPDLECAELLRCNPRCIFLGFSFCFLQEKCSTAGSGSVQG